MLTIVAGAQYQMKQKAKLKVKLLLQQQQSHHTQPAGKSTSDISSLFPVYSKKSASYLSLRYPSPSSSNPPTQASSNIIVKLSKAKVRKIK